MSAIPMYMALPNGAELTINVRAYLTPGSETEVFYTPPMEDWVLHGLSLQQLHDRIYADASKLEIPTP